MGTKESSIGEKADTVLKLNLTKKEAMQAAIEKHKQDLLAGNLVESGQAKTIETTEKDNNPATSNQAKVEVNRLRVNESPWRHHFCKWFWDNNVTPAAKSVVCLLCQV